MLTQVTNGFQFFSNTYTLLKSSEKSRNIFDLIHFGFGFVGLHNFTQGICFEDRDISRVYDNLPEWQQKAFKIIDLLASLSMICKGLNSGTATVVWNWSARVIFNQSQFERLFGNQGIVPTGKIDRSIAFCAFILGLPSSLRTLYSLYTWATSIPPKEKIETNHIRSYKRAVGAGDLYLTIMTASKTAQEILQHTPNLLQYTPTK